MDDILSYNPIKNRINLSTTYQKDIFNMIHNILNGKDLNYVNTTSSTFSSTSPITTSSSITYPTNESGVQQALDNSNYDYVLNELINNRDSYDDISDDGVNMNIAGAYIGKSGYTVFDMTGAIANESSSLNGFIGDITKNNDALTTIENLEQADSYYSSIVNGLDCNNTFGLTDEQKDSCYNLGLVRLTSLSNSVKLLFGGDENIVEKWAEGVDINSSDDLNGNSVIDSSDASACAIVYADNPSNNCKKGSIFTYKGKVVFNKSGVDYNTTLLEIDVGSATHGYSSFYKLTTNSSSNNSVILTDKVCDKSFNISSANPDGINYFPCPTLNNSGGMMTIKESLKISNNIQALFPAGSDTKTTVENYIKSITGSANGTISQDNLSSYLQK
jgi:hypothetical protein